MLAAEYMHLILRWQQWWIGMLCLISGSRWQPNNHLGEAFPSVAMLTCTHVVVKAPSIREPGLGTL